MVYSNSEITGICNKNESGVAFLSDNRYNVDKMWFEVIKKRFISAKNNLAFWASGVTGTMKNTEKSLGKLIDKQKICFIGSVDAEGFPNIKAMLNPRKRNGLKEFFLSTNTSSQKVRVFRKNPKACLYFCDQRFYRGLMLKGTVEVLEDQDSKTMLWEKGDEMYYPDGVTDPDYCVLKFTATSARFYQKFQSSDLEIAEPEPPELSDGLDDRSEDEDAESEE